MSCIGGASSDGAQKSNRPFPYIAAGMLPVLSMPEIALPKKERQEQQSGGPPSEVLKASQSHPASFPHGNFIGGMRLSTLPSLRDKPDARSPTKELPAYLAEAPGGGGGGGGGGGEDGDGSNTSPTVSMGAAPSSVLSGGEAKKAYADKFGKKARLRGFEPASQGSSAAGAHRPLRQFVDADDDDRAPQQNWLDHRGLDSRPPRNAPNPRQSANPRGQIGAAEPSPDLVLAAKKRGGAAAAILSKSATEAAEDAAKGIRGGKSNAMRRQYVRDQQAQKERNRLAEKQREMEQTWQQVPTPQHTASRSGGASVFSPPGSMGGDRLEYSAGEMFSSSVGGSGLGSVGEHGEGGGGFAGEQQQASEPSSHPVAAARQQPAPLQVVEDYASSRALERREAEHMAEAENRGVELSSLASKLQADAYERMRAVKEKEWAEQDAATAAIREAHERSVKERQKQAAEMERAARREEERKAMDAMWEEERQKNAAAALSERLDELADEASAVGRVSLKSSKNAVPKQQQNQPLTATQRRQRAMVLGGRASYGLASHGGSGGGGGGGDDDDAVAAFGSNNALHRTPAPPSTRDPGFDAAPFASNQQDGSGADMSPRSSRDERKLAPKARRKKAREMAAIAAKKKEDQEDFIRAMAVEVTGSIHSLETRILNPAEIASGRGASIPPPPLSTTPAKSQPAGAAEASPGQSVVRVINGEIVTIASVSPQKQGGPGAAVQGLQSATNMQESGNADAVDDKFPVYSEAQQAAMLKRWADRGRQEGSGTGAASLPVGPALMGVDIPAPMSHMGTPSDSGSATGLLASVDAALSGQTKELAAEQAGQEQRPLVASTAAAGEDFDFHAHFGFSAPTSEEQQEVQEQGQGQDADQTAQDSADDAADEWLRQIQMRAKGVSKETLKGQQPQELPDTATATEAAVPTSSPFVYLGRNVKRYFDGYGLFLGRVTAFTPAAMNEDGVDLWTVVYEDDDEEQLTRDEVDESISLFESGIVPTTAEAPEERESEENEVEEEEEAEKEDDDDDEEEEEEEEENLEGGKEEEEEDVQEQQQDQKDILSQQEGIDPTSARNIEDAAPLTPKKDEKSADGEDRYDDQTPLPDFVSPSASAQVDVNSSPVKSSRRRSSGTPGSAYSSDGFEDEFDDDGNNNHNDDDENDGNCSIQGSTAASAQDMEEENECMERVVITEDAGIDGNLQEKLGEDKKENEEDDVGGPMTAEAAEEEARLKQMLAEASPQASDDRITSAAENAEEHSSENDNGEEDDGEEYARYTTRSTTETISVGGGDQLDEAELDFGQDFDADVDTFDADAVLNPRSPPPSRLEQSMGSEGGYSQEGFDEDVSDDEED